MMLFLSFAGYHSHRAIESLRDDFTTASKINRATESSGVVMGGMTAAHLETTVTEYVGEAIRIEVVEDINEGDNGNAVFKARRPSTRSLYRSD